MILSIFQQCCISQARLGYVTVTNRPYIPVAPCSGHLVLTHAKYDVSLESIFSAQ